MIFRIMLVFRRTLDKLAYFVVSLSPETFSLEMYNASLKNRIKQYHVVFTPVRLYIDIYFWL